MSGNQISRRSPERNAGTRTKFTRAARGPSAARSARSAPAYTGSSTRSCRTADPANQSSTPTVSPSSSRTPA
ncbi:hypothetical protein D3105_23225 [Streptomyces globisporus]|uniref:Uncharacterized protein n=1 Tax=Streptomyces globisporus TaxID=1908 RepID=A0A423UV69_STRGL|nr:hypothetical protein D3105_23225 [Streptomyces globisporus]